MSLDKLVAERPVAMSIWIAGIVNFTDDQICIVAKELWRSYEIISDAKMARRTTFYDLVSNWYTCLAFFALRKGPKKEKAILRHAWFDSKLRQWSIVSATVLWRRVGVNFQEDTLDDPAREAVESAPT